MIFNRTLADVQNAKEIRTKKVQQGQALTDDEINILERGSMTINTLNRIENKQAELKTLLNAMGYWNTSITNKTWAYSDIFDITNFNRLINNLNTLKNAFFVYSGTPSTPAVSFHYEDINSLEKILFDLEAMTNDIKERYRECGTFNCGEDEN